MLRLEKSPKTILWFKSAPANEICLNLVNISNGEFLCMGKESK